MKRVYCPKCDGAVVLSDTRVEELRQSRSGELVVVCPTCEHQLRLRLKASKPEGGKSGQGHSRDPLGHIVVVENAFGYRQCFPLYMGENHIGRRNKDTEVDIAIQTADPSMDRHHAIIKVYKVKSGKLIFALADDESHVGTFVGGRILGAREWHNLSQGEVITLGATSLIFSPTPPLEETEAPQVEPQ